jgi:hypothetical protein
MHALSLCVLEKNKCFKIFKKVVFKNRPRGSRLQNNILFNFFRGSRFFGHPVDGANAILHKTQTSIKLGMVLEHESEEEEPFRKKCLKKRNTRTQTANANVDQGPML